MEYHNNFHYISKKYSWYEPNSKLDRVNKQGINVIHKTARNPNSQQQVQNANNNVNNDKSSEPKPYTMVQSFAANFRYNHSKNEIPIFLNDPIHTTTQGFPFVLLEEDDNYVELVAVCRYTLVGNFTNRMPKMEFVRKDNILQIPLTRSVKITHFNARHVYIDLHNEFDYQTIWKKFRMNIEGQVTIIQAWTPDLTQEKESPIVSIWVAIRGLPWNFYNKSLLTTKSRPTYV